MKCSPFPVCSLSNSVGGHEVHHHKRHLEKSPNQMRKLIHGNQQIWAIKGQWGLEPTRTFSKPGSDLQQYVRHIQSKGLKIGPKLFLQKRVQKLLDTWGRKLKQKQAFPNFLLSSAKKVHNLLVFFNPKNSIVVAVIRHWWRRWISWVECLWVRGATTGHLSQRPLLLVLLSCLQCTVNMRTRHMLDPSFLCYSFSLITITRYVITIRRPIKRMHFFRGDKNYLERQRGFSPIPVLERKEEERRTKPKLQIASET